MDGDEDSDALDRARLRQGQVLDGRYRIDDILGHGGMGIVVAATDLTHDRRVALKIPHADRCSARDLERFEREARTVGQLASPHVPRIHETRSLSIDQSTVPAIAFEYIDGADLATWLATRGPLDAATVASIGVQVCHALAEAHALDLVHRDIKPANLMLTTTSEGDLLVKVLDFGISRSRSSKVTTGAVLGSPAYLPPERMRPSMTVDARGDLWSLGIVLYEALAGHLPFESEAFPDLCLKILMDDPPPLAVPNGLECVIRRCLEKQPEDRFQSAHELMEALRPYAASSPQITAIDLELLAHEPRIRRRRRTLIPVALTAVAAIAIAMAVLAGGPAAPQPELPAPPVEELPVSTLAIQLVQREPTPPAPPPPVVTTTPAMVVPAVAPTPPRATDPLASPF